MEQSGGAQIAGEQRARSAAEQTAARDLVFAVCHEIGNLTTAVQFEAHLLGDDRSPRALAASSLKIAGLCARVGWLLSPVRPLLDPPLEAPRPVSPGSILAAVRAVLDAEGVRGASLHFEAGDGLPPVRVESLPLCDLLLGFVYASLERSASVTRIELALRSLGSGVHFTVIDDGDHDEPLYAWRRQALQGRALLCALAERVLGAAGGRVEAVRRGDRTEISLWLPGCEGVAG